MSKTLQKVWERKSCRVNEKTKQFQWSSAINAVARLPTTPKRSKIWVHRDDQTLLQLLDSSSVASNLSKCISRYRYPTSQKSEPSNLTVIRKKIDINAKFSNIPIENGERHSGLCTGFQSVIQLCSQTSIIPISSISWHIVPLGRFRVWRCHIWL